MHNPTAPTPSESAKLSLSTKLAYGAGDLGPAITANILIFYLSPFLTDVARLDPGLAGQTQLIGKVWDAINDPIVGVMSDKTKSRWGRRYPWIVLGAVPFGIFFFLQWLVPTSNQWGLFIYYTIISIGFNWLYTVVNLPYTALTPELTQDYDERTSLNSFRFAFSIGGSILALILVGIIGSLIPNNAGQKYLAIGVVCAVLSVLPLFWCVWGTKAHMQAVGLQNPEAEQPVTIPYFQQLRIAFSNRPFLFVVGIYLCSWLSFQLTAAIIPYFVGSWMRMNSPWAVPSVVLAVQLTAMAMLPVWSLLSKRYGKRGVYGMGMGVWMIAQAGLFFLQPGQMALMYVLAVMAGFGVSVAYLIPWSMLPDVIELDELQTGQRREGVFYSFLTFLQKVCLGVAIAIVLQSLGWAGYIKPTDAVPLPTQPDSVLLAIRLAIGPAPLVALIVGLVLAYFYPITREVHAEILLRLQERKRNQAQDDGDLL
ncbi:MAG: MFS transporter [Stenomitos rutilans HA7619-LM2]|jgi:GPH family glycoside/pentoside/hexuronide:cation symporter|nr:MFS transporter [Stenomitos rutilans HA7619-LM2]